MPLRATWMAASTALPRIRLARRRVLEEEVLEEVIDFESMAAEFEAVTSTLS